MKPYEALQLDQQLQISGNVSIVSGRLEKYSSTLAYLSKAANPCACLLHHTKILVPGVLHSGATLLKLPNSTLNSGWIPGAALGP